MAKPETVWCIDLGNASLKALLCRRGDRMDVIQAEAFDYIEYPKILTQPGAEVEEIISDAMRQFLSRNQVRGHQVAITISGQNGLARFIKLPPVEPKRIPDIVRYEARQQIPFSLDEVVWSYERMMGGIEEEGFVLEAEIGLFAIKRDQVYRALEPFRKAGIEVDVIQLSPLALYNFMVFELAEELPAPQEYDPDSPPPYYVILSMGTDASDLVITNGFRVWQRSIPIGGNHFTRALTKELKLTFAKAEHQKRNAMAAEDPRALFQAMRPVFNDLLTEVQRSINYFHSINRTATITHLIPLGNAMKLPGLKRYLGQMLEFEVVEFEQYKHLIGPTVVSAPAFRENLLSFAPAYGLAVQALGRGRINTNLLPAEIIKERLIRAKKPWAVAAAALLLLAVGLSLIGFSRALAVMDTSRYGSAEQAASQVASLSQQYQQEKSQIDALIEQTDQVGKNLTSHIEGRVQWLELLKAINECLPRDPAGKRPKEIDQRNELHITSLQSVYLDDLSMWFRIVKGAGWYRSEGGAAAGDPNQGTVPATPAPAPANPVASPAPTSPFTPGGAPMAPMGPPGATGPMGPMGATGPMGGPSSSALPAMFANVDVSDGPSGPGYVIQLVGYHYHNRATAGYLQGPQYVRETLIRNLKTKKVLLPKVPGDPSQGVEWVSMKELGIGYPVLVNPGKIRKVVIRRGTGATGPYAPGGEYGMEYGMEEGMGPYGPAAGPVTGAGGTTTDEPEVLELYRFDFVVQFTWQPRSAAERHAAKESETEQQTPTQPATGTPQGQSTTGTPGSVPPQGGQSS